MKQFVLTPAMGKRLIAKAVATHPAVTAALKQGTVAIIAGTTNGYVAEEILASIRQGDGFDRKGFRRGMVVPPGFSPKGAEAKFPGDVIIIDGQWKKGMQIFDVADRLTAGDVVVKGANAVDLSAGHAALYIAHPQAGTIGAVIGSIAGRRVRLLVPVGVEKRVAGDIMDLVRRVNEQAVEGPGMLPLPGEPLTEIEAMRMLCGVEADLLAGGGVYGAEGAVWLGVSGDDKNVEDAEKLVVQLADEPLCEA